MDNKDIFRDAGLNLLMDRACLSRFSLLFPSLIKKNKLQPFVVQFDEGFWYVDK